MGYVGLVRTQPGKPLSLQDLEELHPEPSPGGTSRPSARPVIAKGALRSGAQQKVDRFYLPVLNLNKPEFWESVPVAERRHFTDHVAAETCLHNCCGYPGLKSACCTLDPDDLEHILGPVDEPWVKKTVKWLRSHGQPLATRADVVIDIEEGKVIGATHFKGHRIFQSPESYPMIRFQVMGPRWGCKFLNSQSGKCMIYERRPNMCKTYYCGYVQTRFLLRTPSHPNTYTRVDRDPATPRPGENSSPNNEGNNAHDN